MPQVNRLEAELVLTRDTTWTGKIELKDVVVVPRGVTLTIEPGTEIEATENRDSRIVVLGRLNSAGTSKRPIEVRPPPEEGKSWGGIVFSEGADGLVEHTRFTNARPGIVCAGSAPTIRNNLFSMSKTYKGSNCVLCVNGSRARIEGNTFQYEEPGLDASAILVVNSEPTIVRNRFTNYRAAVHVSALDLLWDAKEYQVKRLKEETPVDRKHRPTLTGNQLTNTEVLSFDEREAGEEKWSQSFKSELMSFERNRTISVGADRGTTVIELFAESGSTNEKKMERHVLRQRGNRIGVDTEIVSLDPSLRGRVPTSISTVTIQEKRYRLVPIHSVLGHLRLDGCRDTKTSYLLLVRSDPQERKTIAWVSPKFERGTLRCAAADINGDGRPEIAVATHRWCEGKGHFLVFQKSEE